MVSDSLWAINSTIIIPEMRLLYKYYLERTGEDCVLDVPAEFTSLAIAAAIAVTDVGELLGRILDWEASSRCSILANVQREHFRCVFSSGVERDAVQFEFSCSQRIGSVMGLPRDPLHSMNPLREDYSNVLKNEVVGREEDIEKLIAIFQQQQQLVSSDVGNGDPFVVAIVGRPGIGKTTLAHMIYHHVWLRQQFHHRIWVDVPSSSSFKTINIGKEFAKSISNEEHCDQILHLDLPLQALWEYVNQQLDGSRYFLVLHCQEFDQGLQEKWAELKNILLCACGGPGSAVLITSNSTIESDFRGYYLRSLSEDAWVELFKRHATTPIPLKRVKQLFRNSLGQSFPAKIVGQFSDNVPDPLSVLGYIYNLAQSTLVGLQLNWYRRLLDANIFDTREVMLHMLTADYLLPAESLASDLLDHNLDTILQKSIRESRRISDYAVTEMLYLRMKVPKHSTAIPSCCRYLCLEINPRARQFRLPTMSVEVVGLNQI